MTRILCVLLTVTASFAVEATPEAMLGRCALANGACDATEVELEDDGGAELLRMELLQQKVHTSTDVVDRLSEKFPNVTMGALIPRILNITSGSGAELKAQPVVAALSGGVAAEEQLRQKAMKALRPGSSRWWMPFLKPFLPAQPRHKYSATAEEVDFATISKNVYKKTRVDPSCWRRDHWETRNHNMFGGNDHLAAYTCQCEYCKPRISRKSNPKACVLAISGTNDRKDWVQNLNIGKEGRFCGRSDYHRGFATEASQMTQSPAFSRMLMQMQTCDRLVLTGHSLGGVLASLLAECINCRNCQKPPILQGVTVEAELYTFGAPAGRHNKASSNDRSPTGTFKGRRFYNRDKSFMRRSQDPVPYIAQKRGFRHPRMVAVGLDSDGDVEVWDVDIEKGTYQPEDFAMPSFPSHNITAYIERIGMQM